MIRKSRIGKELYHKRNDLEYGRDAFLTNPIASANDCTGITQTVPETGAEAESYCDIADVPVTSLDGASRPHRAK